MAPPFSYAQAANRARPATAEASSGTSTDPRPGESASAIGSAASSAAQLAESAPKPTTVSTSNPWKAGPGQVPKALVEAKPPPVPKSADFPTLGTSSATVPGGERPVANVESATKISSSSMSPFAKSFVPRVDAPTFVPGQGFTAKPVSTTTPMPAPPTGTPAAKPAPSKPAPNLLAQPLWSGWDKPLQTPVEAAASAAATSPTAAPGGSALASTHTSTLSTEKALPSPPVSRSGATIAPACAPKTETATPSYLATARGAAPPPVTAAESRSSPQLPSKTPPSKLGEPQTKEASQTADVPQRSVAISSAPAAGTSSEPVASVTGTAKCAVSEPQTSGANATASSATCPKARTPNKKTAPPEKAHTGRPDTRGPADLSVGKVVDQSDLALPAAAPAAEVAPNALPSEDAALGATANSGESFTGNVEGAVSARGARAVEDKQGSAAANGTDRSGRSQGSTADTGESAPKAGASKGSDPELRKQPESESKESASKKSEVKNDELQESTPEKGEEGESSARKTKAGAEAETEGRPRTDSSGSAKLSPDDFEVMFVVGQGAFGKVYQVKQKDTGQIMAMKVMTKARVLERNHVSYMRQERDILTSVEHPFIVQLYYSFQTSSRLYLLLQFVNGGHLFFQLYRQGFFSEDLARFYTSEIVLAVSHLHSLNIMHRDLKPENILLAQDGHIILTDFGLAKRFQSDAGTNSMCGTMEYMAPEIITAKGHGKAADWWSVGVLLFEMVTGKPPFHHKNKKMMQKKILSEKHKCPPFLSAALVALLKGLLTKEYAQRLGSGEDGSEQVKAAAFFRGVRWEALLERAVKPPFKPEVMGESCCANFDEWFLEMPACYSDESPDTSPPRRSSSSSSLADKGDPFAGYSYVSPYMLSKMLADKGLAESVVASPSPSPLGTQAVQGQDGSSAESSNVPRKIISGFDCPSAADLSGSPAAAGS